MNSSQSPPSKPIKPSQMLTNSPKPPRRALLPNHEHLAPKLLRKKSSSLSISSSARPSYPPPEDKGRLSQQQHLQTVREVQSPLLAKKRNPPSFISRLSQNRQIQAVLMMALGSSLITLGFVYSTQQKFHPITTGLIRGLAATVLPYLLSRLERTRFETDLTFSSDHNLKWQFTRNGIMTLQGFFYAWAQFYLPLPICVTMYASTPVFAALWDYLVFGETMNQKMRWWLSLAVLGVIVNANGQYIYEWWSGEEIGSQDTTQEGKYISRDPKMVLIAAIVLAVTQFLHGFGVVSTKKIQNSTTIHVTYFVGLLMLFFNAFLYPLTLDNSSSSSYHYHTPSLPQFLVALFFSGLPLSVGMLCFNASLTLTRHYGVVAPFQFTAILVGYLLSVFRYHQNISILGVFGAIAVCTGIIGIISQKEKEKQRARFEEEQMRKSGMSAKVRKLSDMSELY